tara:strand:- start:3585 stop:4757 length:1173 start_codon:yes stop_codon:yes gene_type:complete
MGLTQHKNSVPTIQEISNLLLLGGHVGREGAGLCPVRGHSNVQGDRTVGINHNPTTAFLDSLSREFGIQKIPTRGLDSVDAVRSMLQREARVFLSMGGNFISAMSDTNATANAIRNCSLTVQISTKPNRSHLITGKTGIILPCLGRTERDESGGSAQFVTVENSMGVVHKSIGSRQAASNNLRSEVSIVSGIAMAIEGKIGFSAVKWGELASDYDMIRDSIEKVIPGFDSYNVRCRKNGGFYLPNPPRDSRIFPTKTGLANFISHDLDSISPKDGEFLMMTIRSHDQYNTTVYTDNDRYRGIYSGRRVVLMNKSDMEQNSWEEFDEVSITSEFEQKEVTSDRWRVVEYDIPRGNVATYFPEANVLVPLNSVADRSNTPTSKSVIVNITST